MNTTEIIHLNFEKQFSRQPFHAANKAARSYLSPLGQAQINLTVFERTAVPAKVFLHPVQP